MKTIENESQGQTSNDPLPREIPQGELERILEAHLKWVKSDGKEGERAKLAHTNLQAATLANANPEGLFPVNLQKADLTNADLRGGVLLQANLQGADLTSAYLHGANVVNANLQGASLHAAYLIGTFLAGANLDAVDLGWANLERSDLSGASLAGARLDGASFIRANLTNAVLVGRPASTEGRKTTDPEGGGKDKEGQPDAEKTLPDPTVAGTNFGMANLTGAKLPASLNEFKDTLRNVKETSRNAQTMYLSLIALCAFVLLTVATTTDAQLILDNFRLKLPIVGADISVVLFYVSAPLLGLLVFLYLHMYLAHLWELAAALPAVFPDGLPLRRKLYPWMLNLVIEEWQREGPGTQHDSQWKAWFRFERLRAWTAIFLGWGLLPLTIVGVAYRFLVRHDAAFSYVLMGLLILSVLFASVAYERARLEVRSEKAARKWWVPAVWTAVALGAGFYATYQGLQGKLPGTTPNIQLRGVDLKGHNFGSVDLSYANLSLANLSRADLRNAKLHGADLHGADITSADLDGVDLAEANLEEANLSGAKLSQAHMAKANLRKTNINRARLAYARLEEADLFMAQLQGADLISANLRGAHLHSAHLEKAILIEAHLEQALFSFASLEGTNLFGAYLQGADLEGADLHGANLRWPRGLTLPLRRTRGLTATQVKAAKNWELAFYSDEFLGELGLPPDHNERVKRKLTELEKKGKATEAKP